jgi:hypothetical protein
MTPWNLLEKLPVVQLPNNFPTVYATQKFITVFTRAMYCTEQHQPVHTTPSYLTKKTNSMALVRERTIPTERPPLVGEVSVNFCG